MYVSNIKIEELKIRVTLVTVTKYQDCVYTAPH
jgi:hypothetical protein